MPAEPGGERGMKTGRRTYGKKHERKDAGRQGRKSARTWLRANWRRLA